MSTKDVVGEYPMGFIEREDEIIVRFYPKTDAKDPETEVLNLRFKITDKYRREKIKNMFNELAKIDH